ncbi:MAG: serine/threonine-protein kinase, partial [Myxococcota bacterium]
MLEPAPARAESAPGASTPSRERRLGEDVDLSEVVLGGRFRLETLIGKGASSIVYRAHDTVLGHDVAIKVLRRDGILASDQASTLAVSLRNETRLAMRLSHPNILRVFHFEQSGGWEYVVMELASGENLHQVVQRRTVPHLSIREVATYGHAVLSALDHAHELGVVHNDLKPANILLCRPGGIKVCDFGLARLTGAATSGTNVAGTPAFMSPERIRGEPGDGRSDLYSLAATFYTLACGHTPFGEKREALRGHLETPFPKVSALPRSLHDVVARAMEKSPDDRFGSAREMLRAWEAAATAAASESPLAPVARGGSGLPDPDALPTEPSIELPSRPVFAQSGARSATDEPSSMVRDGPASGAGPASVGPASGGPASG